MLKRISIFIVLALFATTTSAEAARGNPAKAKPYTGPIVSVTPLHQKPGAPFTISGKRFAPSKKLHVEMDCPMYGHKENGQWIWKATTNKKGDFALRELVPHPRHAKSTLCNVYVLNVTRKGAAWISTGFKID